MSTQKQLNDLKSLGAKSEAMLARAGITTIAKLQDIGSIAAYVKAKQVNDNVSLNLLWALESALSGEPWLEVAQKHRTSLLLAMEEFELTNRSM